jgi:hypothetical protein
MFPEYFIFVQGVRICGGSRNFKTEGRSWRQGGLMAVLKPLVDPGQSPGGVQEAKLPEAYEFLQVKAFLNF